MKKETGPMSSQVQNLRSQDASLKESAGELEGLRVEIDRLREIADRKQAEIEDLRAENTRVQEWVSSKVAEAENQIAEAGQRRAEQDRLINEIEAKHRECDRLQNDLRALMASRSWKITKPFRLAVRIIRRTLPGRGRSYRPLFSLLTFGLTRDAKLRKRLKSSGLFDAKFYLENNPDVAQAGTDALNHYIRFGAKELRDPHPLFDTKHYLERYPQVTQSAENPLNHYIEHGAAELYDPHPLFDADYYAQQYGDEPQAKAAPCSTSYNTVPPWETVPTRCSIPHTTSQPIRRLAGIGPIPYITFWPMVGKASTIPIPCSIRPISSRRCPIRQGKTRILWNAICAMPST